ncbi:peptide chain release factor N(5)-glutamine methyltransferase [Pelagibacteraceae bacterium]|nr:peptide chain release factor N(5)-glutamine methyltransferase [Pelagibacteraceae bacterium]
MPTIQDVFLTGIKKLKNSNILSNQLDAKILLKYTLNLDNENFELKKNDEITNLNLDSYFKLIERRSKGEPVAYIVGKQAFWNDEFKVDKHTLIPRSETELIIENVIKQFPDKESNLNIIDLGTGSGCIIISLLQEYINANGIGVDISQPAIDNANINKELVVNPKRLEFIKADFTNFNLNGFDIIIANPPYISHNDSSLQQSVKEYEPHLALFSKNNGLFFFEQIINNASTVTNNLFYLFLEIGKDQGKDVSNLLKNNNFKIITIENDLAKIPRCIVAKNNNKLELD